MSEKSHSVSHLKSFFPTFVAEKECEKILSFLRVWEHPYLLRYFYWTFCSEFLYITLIFKTFVLPGSIIFSLFLFFSVAVVFMSHASMWYQYIILAGGCPCIYLAFGW